MTKLHRSVTESLKATTLLFIFNFFNPNQAVKNKKSYPLRHMLLNLLFLARLSFLRGISSEFSVENRVIRSS